MENETESDCDNGDGVPQVVDGVHGIEIDDEALVKCKSTLHVVVCMLLHPFRCVYFLP